MAGGAGSCGAGRARVLVLLCSLALCRRPSAAQHPEAADPAIFEPTGRGTLKYGDPCSTFRECGFAGAVCHHTLKTCSCHDEMPATNHVDKCGRVQGINETCFFNEQCEEAVLRTECRAGRCACLYEMVPDVASDGAVVCIAPQQTEVSLKTVDPAMIGVLVGMALMFVIICVVLRLFSKARWSENRTIFNTPNPRLMNVSLLRESKLLHAQDRRGSRASMRPPSRATSQQEIAPHSHHVNQLHRHTSASRRGSRASSSHSGASQRSARSPLSPHGHPASVTVEIREPNHAN